MAHLLLRPLRQPQFAYKQLPQISLRPAQPSIVQQIQQRRWATQPSIDLPRDRAQPSLRLQAVDGSESMLRDIGLLPDTYISPSRKNLPSLFKDPKARLQLLKRRILYKVKNLLNLALFRYYCRIPLEYTIPKKIAPKLYETMYTAFAEGNTALLRQICCDGLYDSFKSRIIARGRGKTVWRMQGLVGAPKLISNNAIVLGDLDMGFRQAVVKINSLQMVYRFDTKGRPLPASGETVPVVEYLVLQKRKTKSGVGEWMVWGTTEETTLDILKHREETSPLVRR